MQVGDEETSKAAGALLTDVSRLGGVWIPPLRELVDPTTVPGDSGTTRGPRAFGHVVVTIEPGCAVTMTTLCGFMVPT